MHISTNWILCRGARLSTRINAKIKDNVLGTRIDLTRGWGSRCFASFDGLDRVGSGAVHVAMSGGVDSSTVAAMLARKFGKDRVHGVYMNNWSSNSKCQESSFRAVREVCSQLGISCRRVDFERDYWTDVFEPMLEQYQRGFTPNPDVSCNRYIKFGRLATHLRATDPAFKWIATGHYAGVQDGLVRRAKYMPKDQSYYLATVAPIATQHILFPLAELSKPRVRELAAELGLGAEISEKPDSQGLCFVEQQQDVGQRGFRKFLSEYLTETPGPIVLAKNPNKVVGEHSGLWTHTVGQRVSLSLPQHLPEFWGQWFVVGKDIDGNKLLVDRGNSELLLSNCVYTDSFVWHRMPAPGAELYAQFRSLQQPWKISSWEDGRFEFSELRRAVAPGQFLVVYENDIVVGAGIIERALMMNRTNEQTSAVNDTISVEV